MEITSYQKERLIDAARLARDGRKLAYMKKDSLTVDFFQSIMDNVLSIVKIPNQEHLK